jgi:shikimate dehydrogenase
LKNTGLTNTVADEPGARKAAVLGLPISHSLSPVLHRAAYAALGLDGWSYQAVECDEAGLPALLAGLGPDWAGLSLTMPLKRAVLPLLDRADPVASQTGAANTVVFRGGARHGYNTDVAGLVTALTEANAGPGPGGGALILGAGATACSALAALHELGLREVTVAARDPARATGLLATASRLGTRVSMAPFGILNAGLDLLISTVPSGAADLYTARLREVGVAPRAILDVVYHPWPTPLAAAGREVGAITIGGFEFLLHQAARQVELMTGRPAPVAAMHAAGLAELSRRASPARAGRRSV